MATKNRLAFTKNLNQENVKKVTTNPLYIPGQTRRAALGEIGNKVTLKRGAADNKFNSSLLTQKNHVLQESQKLEKLQDNQEKVVDEKVVVPKARKPIMTTATAATTMVTAKAKEPATTKAEKVEELHNKLNDVVQIKSQEDLQNKVETTEAVAPLPSHPPIEDIDEEDKNNPILVSIYSNDIHDYLRSLEKQFPIKQNFLKEKYITPKMRSVLVDWLVEVHQQFHLLQETLYMTVAIIDRFLQSFDSITTKTLQLVGVTAMFIASKYEEMYSPDISDFMYITDNTYTKKDILQMELLIIRKLNYSFGRPLPLHFLRRYSKAGKVFPIHHTMAKYFLELSLIHYEMCHYPPSLIAAAAIYLAIYVTADGNVTEDKDKDSIWTDTLVYYSTYTKEKIMPVVYDIAYMVINTDKNKYQSVHKKYMTTKNMKVSLRAELRSSSMIYFAQKKTTKAN